MPTDVKDIAERVDVLRDRFTGWALLVGTVSLVVAVWTTAPTLEIDLPLPGSAKVSLNVGYVLALGMPLLAIAYAWTVAPLLAVSRYQDSIAREIGLGNASLSPFERLRLFGPYAEPAAASSFSANIAWFSTFMARALVLFLLPIVGQIWIANKYFTAMQYFDIASAKAFHTANLDRWDIRPRERVQVLEYLFASEPNLKNHAEKDLTPEYYFFENGTLEEECIRSWIKPATDSSSKTKQNEEASGSQQPGSNSHQRCVFTSFPKFKLWMNSWANLISLAAVIHLTVVGFGIFSGMYFRRRLAEEMQKQNPPTGP